MIIEKTKLPRKSKPREEVQQTVQTEKHCLNEKRTLYSTADHIIHLTQENAAEPENDNLESKPTNKGEFTWEKTDKSNLFKM